MTMNPPDAASAGCELPITTVLTFTATIYVGMREGRTDDPSPVLHSIEEVYSVVQEFTDSLKGKGSPCGCVTVAPTRFIYGGGWEDGVAIGFINYPRFPGEASEIRHRASALARTLMVALGQMRVTIVFPYPFETLMLSAVNAVDRRHP